MDIVALEAIEKALARIWSDVLGLDPATVGADDSFLELGGDSIAAAQCVNRVYNSFGVQLDVTELLSEEATVKTHSIRMRAMLRSN